MSNDRMAMYEAQAIAVEKQLEIDRLKQERDELAEGMRRLALQLGRTEEPSAESSGDVLTAVNRLMETVETLQGRIEEVDERVNELQQNSTRIWEAINDLRQHNAIAGNILPQSIAPMPIVTLGGDDGKSIFDEKQVEKEQRLIPTENNESKNITEQMDITLTEQNIGRTGSIIQIKGIVDFVENKRLIPMEKDYPKNHHENDGNETILIMGVGEGMLTNIFIFLRKNEWETAASFLRLPDRIGGHGTLFVNEEIYIFGGNLGSQSYKLGKDLNWVQLADMHEERWLIMNSCLEWNGFIWVFGGSAGEHLAVVPAELKSVERYDPKENKWTKMPSMNHARSYAAAVVWNDKFMICGGSCGAKALKSVECFDPKSGVWTELDDLPTPISAHVIIPYRNSLILIGGYNGMTVINSVLELKSFGGKQAWRELPSMKNGRFVFSAVVLNDEIYVIGGYDGTSDLVEIFNGTKWRDGPDLPPKRVYMSAVVIPQNFLSIGGYDGTSLKGQYRIRIMS